MEKGTSRSMTTLSEVMEDLRLRNQDIEFRYLDGVFSAGKGKNYQPSNLTIVKTYRFEGESNPSDTSILYLIKSDDDLVGYLIDAYGTYSNQEDGFNQFLQEIKVERSENSES